MLLSATLSFEQGTRKMTSECLGQLNGVATTNKLNQNIYIPTNQTTPNDENRNGRSASDANEEAWRARGLLFQFR